MKYFSEFNDIDNNTIRVEVITDGGGEDQELNVAWNGINVTYEGGEIYKPIIKSGASIDFVIENVISDFYTGNLLSPKVYIYKNGTLFWYGYITPNAYTQPYNLKYETMTIECIDILAQAGNVDYTYIVDATNQATFIDIIKHILDLVDPNNNISNIFVTNTISLNGNSDILSRLSILERNFTDELENKMKCDEVLEEICKYLGLTIFQFLNGIYVIDFKNIDAQYTTYNRGGSGSYSLNNGPVSIYQLGITEENGSISLEGLYNKVTIVANTLKQGNPIEEDTQDEFSSSLFGDLVDNTEIPSEASAPGTSLWINPNRPSTNSSYSVVESTFDGSYHYTYPRNENIWTFEDKSADHWNEYKLLVSWWKTAGQWRYNPPFMYEGNNTGSTYSGPMSIERANAIWTYFGMGGMKWNQGSTWQKVFCYSVDDIPTKPDWKNYFTISCQNRHTGLDNYFFSYTSPVSYSYKGGGLIINMDFYFSMNNTIAADVLPEPSVRYDDTISNDTSTLTKNRLLLFPAKLSIGDFYWNGESWQQYSSSFLQKLNGGYFDYTLYSDFYSATQTIPITDNWKLHIWKIWNSSYQDWEYVTESVYNNYTGTKEVYNVPTYYNTTFQETYIVGPYTMYYIQKGGQWVQVDAAYQNQFISDRFWLYKKFKNGDSVYGGSYNLTNTCTYNIPLTEPTEGQVLLIPNDMTLTGVFKFSVGRPTQASDALTPGGLTGESLGNRILHISSLYVKYSTSGETTSSNNDIVYTNEISGGYVNELEDIKMRVNTYSDTMSSYSYVMNGSEYLDTLTYNGKTQKQENNIIDKLVDHYSHPKFIYTNTLHNKFPDDEENNITAITPGTRLTEPSLGVTMPISGIIFDLHRNYATVTCIEV